LLGLEGIGKRALIDLLNAVELEARDLDVALLSARGRQQGKAQEKNV
jgi:hypothetical protein